MDNSRSKLRTWERRIETAKQKHRPKLKKWSKDRFADRSVLGRFSNFISTFSNLSKQIRDVSVLTANTKSPSSLQVIDRVSCDTMTLHEFIEYYERPELPCIISNIPKFENWAAVDKWKIRNKELLNHKLGSRYFKVGEDDDGYKVKIRMKYFLKYLKNNNDDSPLYIFDGNYDDDDVSKCLLNDYKIPSYFPDDLFHLVGESRRPPYRWFLIGPSRSGTCIHIDPLGTSAWNTVLEGRKLWVLFPPGTNKSIAKGLDVIKKGEDDEAINYFVDILPRIQQKHGAELQILQFIQEPGDTVFVPVGWWHAVLNLEDSIAITQNFCSRTNFDKVWRRARTGRKKMSVKWLKKLRVSYPDIASRAELLNEVDGFEMENTSTAAVKDSEEQPKKKRKKH